MFFLAISTSLYHSSNVHILWRVIFDHWHFYDLLIQIPAIKSVTDKIYKTIASSKTRKHTVNMKNLNEFTF